MASGSNHVSNASCHCIKGATIDCTYCRALSFHMRFACKFETSMELASRHCIVRYSRRPFSIAIALGRMVKKHIFCSTNRHMKCIWHPAAPRQLSAVIEGAIYATRQMSTRIVAQKRALQYNKSRVLYMK